MSCHFLQICVNFVALLASLKLTVHDLNIVFSVARFLRTPQMSEFPRKRWTSRHSGEHFCELHSNTSCSRDILTLHLFQALSELLQTINQTFIAISSFVKTEKTSLRCLQVILQASLSLLRIVYQLCKVSSANSDIELFVVYFSFTADNLFG